MRAHGPWGARVDELAVLKVALAELSLYLIDVFDIFIHKYNHSIIHQTGDL